MDFQADRIVNKWLEMEQVSPTRTFPTHSRQNELVAAQETEANATISITLRHLTFSTDVQWIASLILLAIQLRWAILQFVNGVASGPQTYNGP